MQINWSVKIVPNKRRNTFQRPAVSADHLTISLFLELFYTLSVQLSVTVQKLCEASRKGNNSGDLLYEASPHVHRYFFKQRVDAFWPFLHI